MAIIMSCFINWYTS